MRSKASMGLGLALAIALLLWAGGLALGGTGVTGSVHDFSDEGWGEDQICIFCHTPHHADATVADSPLWNHAVTTSTFTLYDSTTLDATVGQPDGVSKLCLSCHDGSIAIDSYGGATGTHFVSGGEALGTTLSNDHPISFTYDAALATADGELATPTVVNGKDVVGNTTQLPLFGGKLECATCHDVHDGTGTVEELLRTTNVGSALCLNCHNK